MSSLPRQHELLLRVSPWSGNVSKGVMVDFLGIRTRVLFVSKLKPYDQEGFSSPSLPPFDEEYFEWVDLFESIARARGDFTMIELGAGYGRWLVRAAFAARSFGNLPCKLIGVEAEPKHFEWMRLHFNDNGLNADEHTLIRAAVSKRDGGAWFLVGRPSEWYGQRVVSLIDFWLLVKERTKRLFTGPRRDTGQRGEGSPPSYRMERVRTVSLNTIMAPLQKVDLVDLDVQGTEFEVLSSAAAALDAKVGRVHIGTHYHKGESGLCSLFKELGWHNVFDFPTQKSSTTPWGAIKFLDGVQSWVNPRFLS